jgi:SAM-dependent methyltransferase
VTVALRDIDEATLRALDRLRQTCAAESAAFRASHAAAVDHYRALISSGVTASLAALRADVAALTDDNPICNELVDLAAEYVDWLQWTFWDLPYFAVALRPGDDELRESVAACGQVYLAIRVFDDVIDRHFWFKGRRPTLLGATSERFAPSQGAESLTLLAGLLLCFDGLAALADPARTALAGRLQPVVQSARHAVVGAIMEHSGREDWSPAYFDRLVQLKNVDYWRGLYAALDPEAASPLVPFLERYYALAQWLNDVQDVAEDERIGQPNVVSLQLARRNGARPCPPRDGAAPAAAPAAVLAALAEAFLELGRLAQDLAEPERGIAGLKLGESLAEADRLGLFAAPGPVASPNGHEPQAPLGLHWLAQLHEVVAGVGVAGLEQVDCPVCRSDQRHFLFRKQGFPYHRCRECGHIYVTPRITPEVQARLARELDSDEDDDIYLEVQKIYAAPLCHLFRARAPGSRLLDLGFGRGYLMQLARAYGFEVYGLDLSASNIDHQWPQLGRRLASAVLGQDELPWGSFDVVVMSHILEHLPEPDASLRQVWEALNPGGLLYVAVPDMRSLAFQVFGKRWDVVNPLVHYQYFDEDSLRRLLGDCGYGDFDRIQQPPMNDEVTPRWIRLMRRLGGTDSNELAILARKMGE